MGIFSLKKKCGKPNTAEIFKTLQYALKCSRLNAASFFCPRLLLILFVRTIRDPYFLLFFLSLLLLSFSSHPSKGKEKRLLSLFPSIHSWERRKISFTSTTLCFHVNIWWQSLSHSLHVRPPPLPTVRGHDWLNRARITDFPPSSSSPHLRHQRFLPCAKGCARCHRQSLWNFLNSV